jgi:hypothetical protein
VRALVSYPGSGNTWARFLLVPTGLRTGDERDWTRPRSLSLSLFQSLSLPGTHTLGADLLVKSHHVQFVRQVGLIRQEARKTLPWRIDNLRYFGGDGVLLLRSPWAAIRSSWNHLQVQMHYAVDTELGSPEFQRFAMAEAAKWRDLAADWLVASPRLLVLHYEHLLEDWEREVRRVVTFLGLEPDEERLDCMHGQSFEGFLRQRPAVARSPYSGPTAARLRAAVGEVQALLAARGQEPLPLHLYSPWAAEEPDNKCTVG